MNENLSEILGKTIRGITIKEHNKPGVYHSQLFLVFDDGSSYEFFSDCAISPSGSLNRRRLADNMPRPRDDDMVVVYQAQATTDG